MNPTAAQKKHQIHLAKMSHNNSKRNEDDFWQNSFSLHKDIKYVMIMRRYGVCAPD